MHRPFDSRVRAAPGVLLVAILTATSAPASSVALATDAGDTDPALVAEAQAVMESIVVEPTESGHRLVFRLLEGWDPF